MPKTSILFQAAKILKVHNRVMQSCHLCSEALPQNSILDGDLLFCCPGCRAVFHILSAAGQLADYQDSHLFQLALKTGLISNPALIDQIAAQQKSHGSEEKIKLVFEIQEMWCPSCAEIIKLMLLKERGVQACVIDYATDLASVQFNPRLISKENLFKIIGTLGYKARHLSDNPDEAVGKSLILRFILAAFCSLNLMMFSYPLYATYFDADYEGHGKLLAWISFYCSLPVLLYSAYPIFRRFYSSLKAGFFGMEALVLIGVLASFGLSCYELWKGGVEVYFDSMTVIIVFVLLGKIIESKAKFSSKHSLLALSRSIPKRGRKRCPDGTDRFVPLKDISKGDVLTVLTGEKIPLDGIVIDGEGACDESLMTGESLPVVKQRDSFVTGGAILQSGRLLFKVTHTIEETTLKHILDSVEHEIGRKTGYDRPVDSIVRLFVPIVLLISFFTFCFVLSFGSFNQALIRAITVLLISCPCAIGIAAPLAESYLMQRFAALGVIVRNRGALKLLGQEAVFVFDKTGTITEGKFKVLSGLDQLDTLEKKILKGMALSSIHPASQAIASKISDEPVSLTSCVEMAGYGLKAIHGSDTYFLGSEGFLMLHGIRIISSVASSDPSTSVFFGKNNTYLTEIKLGDRIKEGALELIQSLKPVYTVLLSGDREPCVQKTAEALNFNAYFAERTPLQKKIVIDDLLNRHGLACMMGDGINDAPALTASSISISAVNASDISIHVSDFLLTGESFAIISKMRTLALKGQRIIKQNLFWAFFYNVIGIGLAVSGTLTPIFAAFAMIASSFICLFNSQRLLK